MSDKKAKQRGLGRGLSALMSDVTDQQTSSDSAPKVPDMMVPIERISANPDQPRRQFDKDLLDDLTASIREKGIIQPLIVRPMPGKAGDYQIVAGERRWRAAQQAQLHRIPVLIREFDDTEVLEIAIIENIQRADLNPVEEAAGYQQLMQKFGHTQEKLAEALGKSRSHIANTMRLMQLPEPVQAYVRNGQLTAGHARALITSDDPVALAQRVVKKALSVRETEKLAKTGIDNVFSPTGKTKRGKASNEKDADTRALEADLSAAMGMKVVVDHTTGEEGGRVSISYGSLDDLDTICRILSNG
ncbi:ParB/RepB/Spo0J family partition protein [Roseovarius pelagicus]|uniref:ParB/RepB/Spo0J family partition protein n=1 Tax=Roseovarius pelagicus TaxID=2980108 RepID=A0ABY6D6V5_9RHOB|nr:ParB/RepB/Spo0J family partition protein [Roseovarius pelagicus]UXX81886.1 ParB/RepB/Spo0J family partition protein [Roseovarius pelagicus]